MNGAGHHPGKLITYKEYAAHKAAEGKALTSRKLTLVDEENWNQDEWKLMVNQDPHSRSVAGDSGHGTMAVMPGDEPVDSNEGLVRAVGGIDENVSAENLSDVEWKEDEPLFEFNDENVTIPQTADAVLAPVQTSTENKTGSSLESSLEKMPCFWESITVHLLKAAPPLCLEPDYNDTELVGYTWSLLVNVIPWIKYKAQNMSEPTFRQELQCIREVDHLQYIKAMIVWFH